MLSYSVHVCWLNPQGILELREVRKLFQSLALIGPAGCMLALAQGPETSSVASTLFTGAVALGACSSAGFGSSVQDLKSRVRLSLEGFERRRCGRMHLSRPPCPVPPTRSVTPSRPHVGVETSRVSCPWEKGCMTSAKSRPGVGLHGRVLETVRKWMFRPIPFRMNPFESRFFIVADTVHRRYISCNDKT